MFMRLLLAFTLIPGVELYLLLWSARLWGPGHTIAVIVLTGIIGSTMAKHQGTRVWRETQEQLAMGQAPSAGLLDGVLILIAGALLLTPGFLTDATGFALLVPKVREHIRRRARIWLERKLAAGEIHIHLQSPQRRA